MRCLLLCQRAAPLVSESLLPCFLLLHALLVLLVPQCGVCQSDVAVEEVIGRRPLVGRHSLQSQSSILHLPQPPTTATTEGRREVSVACSLACLLACALWALTELTLFPLRSAIVAAVRGTRKADCGWHSDNAIHRDGQCMRGEESESTGLARSAV